MPQIGKNDIKSGFFVFLLALPLSLGIAMASGYPPIAGVLTAIIGGTIASFLGSSPLSIKGPAAGLIVVVLGAVQELGDGNVIIGYQKALAVGSIAALLQITFALRGAAAFGFIMSPSVVHGMLAAVGVIIIAKQSHVLLGVIPTTSEPLSLLAELPYSIANANLPIAAIGIFSLVIMFFMPYVRNKFLKAIPSPIVVLAFSIPCGLWLGLDKGHFSSFLGQITAIGPQYLVQLPGSLFDVITFPDFSSLFTWTSLKYIIMFALIGTIESTLSVLAIDSMDPKKRSSNLNRDLFAVGAGNLLSSMVGGLPMISEIVRSKANIDAGAESKMSNFYHGLFLLIAVTAIPALLGQIPLAALAAMLVFVGSRLASPRELFHMNAIGKDQLFLFVATFFTTLATDLLVGVMVGIALKLMMLKWRGASIRSLFYPRIDYTIHNIACTIIIHEAATFGAVLGIRKIITQLPSNISLVIVDVSHAAVVDHTFLTRIAAMNDELNVDLTLQGLHAMHSVSKHPLATRIR